MRKPVTSAMASSVLLWASVCAGGTFTYQIDAHIRYDVVADGVTYPDTPVWGMPGGTGSPNGTLDLVIDNAGNVSGASNPLWGQRLYYGDVYRNAPFELIGGSWGTPVGKEAPLTGGAINLSDTFIGDFSGLSNITGFLKDGNSGDFFHLGNGLGPDGKLEFTATGPDGMSMTFTGKAYGGYSPGPGTHSYTIGVDSGDITYTQGSDAISVGIKGVVSYVVLIDAVNHTFSIPEQQLLEDQTAVWWAGGRTIDDFSGTIDASGNFVGTAHYAGFDFITSLTTSTTDGTFQDGNSEGFDVANGLLPSDTFTTVLTDSTGQFDLVVNGMMVANDRYWFGNDGDPWSGAGWTSDAAGNNPAAAPGAADAAFVNTNTVSADGANVAQSVTIANNGTLALPAGTSVTLGQGATIDTATGGALSIGLADGTSGQLAAGGTANLGGTLSLSATAASFPAVALYTETIVTGTINGTFDSAPADDSHLSDGVFVKSIAYNANDVSVTVLQALAGDADGNQGFNFADLVQIFAESGAVYGNASPPTPVAWPGGDFTGEGAFTFTDLVEAFAEGGADYGSGNYLAAGLAGPQGRAVSLVYDQATGQLSIDAGDTELVALSIESAGGLLEITPEADALLDGFADIANSGQFAKLDLSGMSSLDFGAALSAMLSESDLLADLTVTGALLGGGRIEDVSLAVTAVPEPGAVLMLLSALAAMLLWRRRRRR